MGCPRPRSAGSGPRVSSVWSEDLPQFLRSLLPISPPAPAQGHEASASLLLSPTTLSPDLHKTPQYSLPEVMVPFSPFHFIQMPPPQSSFLVTRSKVSSSHLSHSTPFFFLGSIYDNYPFICLISTFPTRMRVLRE